MAFHAPLSNECEYNLRKRGSLYVLFFLFSCLPNAHFRNRHIHMREHQTKQDLLALCL